MVVFRKALPGLVWCPGLGFGSCGRVYSVLIFISILGFLISGFCFEKWFFKLGHWERRRNPVFCFFPGKWIYFILKSAMLSFLFTMSECGLDLLATISENGLGRKIWEWGWGCEGALSYRCCLYLAPGSLWAKSQPEMKSEVPNLATMQIVERSRGGAFVVRSKRVLRKICNWTADSLSFHDGPLSFSATSVQVCMFCEQALVQAGTALRLCVLSCFCSHDVPGGLLSWNQQ